ncbi:MAG: hypothetical protein KGM91_16055, partial [Burkholderiales bacterium]|nr:hypothetical protein [Burkholderiales bacterium]
TELTLCIYLLQMRELFRWERGFALGASLPQAEVGAWLDARERLWDELEDAPYRLLPLGEGALDPFDSAAVNEHLLPHGLVYGAGRLATGRPLFFLGELERAEQRQGLQVRLAGRELARGLAAPPAALCGGEVLLRRDALRRWLWERFETWGPRGSGHAFMQAMQAAGHRGGDPARALDALAEIELETLLLHEIGEHRAGLVLGPGWSEMRLATGRERRIEPRLRALRDHLADCLVTLPALVEGGAPAALHLWFANLDGLRLEMFPRLAAAYASWREDDAGRALRSAIEAGSRHWPELAARLVRLHADRGAGSPAAIIDCLGAADARC